MKYLKQIDNMEKKLVWAFITILICILAVILYLGSALRTTSFSNDEFQSATTAYNLLNGNGFLKTDTYDGVATYTRAWPATILLAGWIKLWGMSEITCRSLSIVYGVLFILSIIYISNRMFKSIGYSLIVSLMCVAETSLTKYFGITRMYSLEMLLVVWMYYFIFRVLEWENNSRKRNVLYAVTTTIISFFTYETHVNAMLPLGGGGGFYCYSGVCYEEEKISDSYNDRNCCDHSLRH